MFKQNNLVSQEAGLVVFLLSSYGGVCVNENEHMNKAAPEFSKESIPCSSVSSVSNTKTICGHAAANVYPFPQIKWRITGSHGKSCPKSW